MKIRRTPSFLVPFATGFAVALAVVSPVGQADPAAGVAQFAAGADGDAYYAADDGADGDASGDASDGASGEASGSSSEKGAAAAKADRSQRYQDLALFTSILELVRGHYVEEVDEHALLQSAMHGLLADLDPHSSFMEPTEFDEMQVETKGEFHGLGIEISKATGEYLEVVSPIEGTPAQRAGIKARDRISSICPTEKPPEWSEPCRGTAEMSLGEAVSLMRGRKGTSITIYVLREGMAEPRRYDIQRDTVTVASVRSEIVEPGIGHLRVSSFQERTGQDVGIALDRLEEKNGGTLTGLVVDLRDNPGGLLNQAVDMADHWLDEGLVVYTQGRDARERTEYRSNAAVHGGDYPIVVLVNEGSASASEIVAGALQDRSRAIVLGKPTFGKGSVQTVYPLEGGAGLRLTTALYYTPSGRSIQEVGIRPDIEVGPAEEPELGLPDRRRMRESDLDGHFTQKDATGKESTAPVPIKRVEPIWPGRRGTRPEAEDGDGDAGSDGDDGAEGGGDEADAPKVDVQLARAVEVLKTWQYFDDLRGQRADAGKATAAGAGADATAPKTAASEGGSPANPAPTPSPSKSN